MLICILCGISVALSITSILINVRGRKHGRAGKKKD